MEGKLDRDTMEADHWMNPAAMLATSTLSIHPDQPATTLGESIGKAKLVEFVAPLLGVNGHRSNVQLVKELFDLHNN